MSLEIGQVLESKYRIVRLIGEGGMGSVFEGENTRVRRKVAIKVLHAGAAANAETVQRFEREAQAAGQIGSDHILEIIDLGSLPGGERFMVMEYLDGEPLSARIQRKRMTPNEVAPLAKQVLVGLAAAHAAGIIHRDLKPDNIFVLREKAGIPDYVKLIDFGISKFQSHSADGMRLTRTGSVMGTPYYMSPEQANGTREADARSDIYSVGVILYEAITGQVPFDARSFNELLFKIVLSNPVPPQQAVPDLDPAFCSIVMKAMARDLPSRFQSCEDFGHAIEKWMRAGMGATVPPEFQAVLGEAPAVQVPGPAPVPTGTDQTVVSVANPTLGSAAATATLNPPTAGSWATSQPDEPASIPKSSSGVLAAVAASVLVVALGGFVTYKIFSKKEQPVTASVAPAAMSVESPAAMLAPAPPPAAHPATASAPPPAAPAEPVVPAAPSATAAPAKKSGGAAAAKVPAKPPTGGKVPATKKGGGAIDFGY